MILVGDNDVTQDGQVVKRPLDGAKDKANKTNIFPITTALMEAVLGKKKVDGRWQGKSYDQHEKDFSEAQGHPAVPRPLLDGAHPPREARFTQTPGGAFERRASIEAGFASWVVRAAAPLKMNEIKRASMIVKVSVESVAGGEPEN